MTITPRGRHHGRQSSGVRILLADDGALARFGMHRLLLGDEPDPGDVTETADGERTVALAQRRWPEILLLDVDVPGLTGGEIAQVLRAALPDVGMTVLTGWESAPRERTLIRIDVAGLTDKASARDRIVSALRAVCAADLRFRPALSQLRAARPRWAAADDRATPRELDVLRLVDEGSSNREVADRLGISEATVQFHLSQLFAKLGATSRTHLVHLARQKDWIA